MGSFLSSIGIGSATVDTVLDTETMHPGDTVDLHVEIEGGSEPQDIESIYFLLETRYTSDDGAHRTATIQRATAETSFTIEADDYREFPASMTLPEVTPLTEGSVEVWLKTGLEVDMAKDPQDRDYIEVVPTEKMAAVLDAVERLGFSLSESECKESAASSAAPFVQEFEFESDRKQWEHRLDELEIIFAPTPETLGMRIEVDRHDWKEGDLSGNEERNRWVTVDTADSGRLQAEIRAQLNTLC